jgi:urease accessory protein
MRAILALLLILLPTAAYAHPGHGEAVGLLAGIAHPLGGLDHILCMVAVGVFAFVLGGRALWLVPLSFVGMMTVGFLLGANGVSLPLVEVGIALSSIVIGVLAASGRPMPVWAAMGVAGLFAVFHGHAHGAEMPATADGLQFALGFIAATALLHVVGIGGAMLIASHGNRAARLVGGAFALGGLGVLAGWL